MEIKSSWIMWAVVALAIVTIPGACSTKEGDVKTETYIPPDRVQVCNDHIKETLSKITSPSGYDHEKIAYNAKKTFEVTRFYYYHNKQWIEVKELPKEVEQTQK